MSTSPHGSPGPRIWAPDSSSNPVSVCDFAAADYNRHKPTFAQLREEGLSQYAIETLVIGREGMGVDPAPGAAAARLAEPNCYLLTAAEVADMLRDAQVHYPVDVDDVWPEGIPERWQDWSQYDPTDAELAIAWNAPDSPAAHRAAWALHTEVRS